MFPKKTVRLIIFATNLAWYCGTLPFRFRAGVGSTTGNPQTLVITPSFTKWRAFYVRTTFFVMISYISFILLRLVYKLHFHQESLTFGLQMGYQFFGFSMIVVLHVNTLYMWKEVPRFFMRYFSHFRYFKDRFGIPGVMGPKCLKFFYAWFLVSFLVNLQNTVLLIKKPSRSHYYTAILESPEKTPMLTRLPLMLLQIAVWVTSWSQVIALCFHLYAYFSGLVWAIRELDIQVRYPKTTDLLRQPKTFHTELRSLQVLHRLWQHAHEGWFCPSHKCVAVCVATLGSYGLLKLTGLPSYTMALMAGITLIYVWTLFDKFGQLHDISRDMLWNWRKHPNTSKWLKKFVRSVPVFCVNVGDFYRVQRMTVFTTLLTVLNNTITILLL